MRHLILLFLLTLIQVQGFSQPVKSFFVVHADPHEPNGVIFSDLIALVDTANSFSVKLTIELSKPWCDTILSSSNYLAKIRLWQTQGHEIAVHHHDYGHAGWDGYSNTNPHPPHSSGQPYLGSMQLVYDVTDSVCGDSLCLTIGSGPDSLESVTDFNPQWIYKTDGGLVDSNAYSNVTQTNFGQYEVCQLSYTYFANMSDLNGVQALFNSSNKSVCGIVTHVWNWAANKPMFVNWLNYISTNTPNQCKTVRQIIRESGCATPTRIQEEIIAKSSLIIYPNPTNGSIHLQFNEINVIKIEIYNLQGKLLFIKNLNKLLTFYNLDFSYFENGIYTVRIITPEKTVISKIIKQ